MTDTITLPREVAKRILRNIEIGNKLSAGIEMRREIEAALEQPQDHPEQRLNMVPEGWKLVPTDPTPEMIKEMHAYDGTQYSDPFESDDFKDDYRNMLDAAPRPPVRERPQVEQEPVAWAEEIIEYLHAYYDTEMIKEIDSGDALIRLDDAIAAVEEVAQRHTHPQPQREPLTEADLYNIASNYFADEWAQRKAVMMLKDHGIGGEA